jgi:hypothetical protein
VSAHAPRRQRGRVRPDPAAPVMHWYAIAFGIALLARALSIVWRRCRK